MAGLRVFLSVVLFLVIKAENPVPDIKSSIQTNEVPTDKSNDEQKIDYRLPMDGMTPSNYDLTIVPNFKDFSFSGEVHISLNTGSNARKKIVLHAKDLETRKDASIKCGLTTVNVKYVDTDATRDFLNLEFDNEIAANTECVLSIKYTGKITDELRGFYRSSYVNDKNETVWLATTHFEPVGARRAFPCFDEPALKAAFEIKIQHPKNYSAVLSNSVIENTFTESENNMTVTIFQKTPKMSTYLVAFVVSDFQSVVNDNDQKFKVWARPNAYKTGQFAADIGRKMLTHLEKFTNKPFEIGKMDQIAIPDFAAGAMENWGLVTYRESSLLYDETTTPSLAKQNIASTIAHEFAHQWFGNLVSPAWWKYVWLNEGFANFFQYYIMHKEVPDWRAIEQQVVKSTQATAFLVDSTDDTHPLNYDVQSPKEISNVFDKIIYQKGGSVIRMIQHMLTEPVFQKGLQNYIDTNKLMNATSDELVAGWQAEIDKNFDLKTKLDNWLNKSGYPVVTVNATDDGNVTITQEQFFAKRKQITNNIEQVEWWVPINYATQNEFDNNTAPTHWLEPNKKLQFTVNASEWIIVNKQQTGYYRVNYDEKNWKRIIQYLKSANREKIHVLNRAQLIDDALAFAKEGRMSHTTLLELSSYLADELDYVPWYPGYRLLEYLNGKFVNNKAHADFKEYALTLLSKVSKANGFENATDHISAIHRISAQSWACQLGQKECNDKAQELFNNWLNPDEKKSLPDPDVREVVLCNGIRNANEETWNKLLTRYLDAKESVEKQQIYRSLGCSSNIAILNTFLNMTLEAESKIQHFNDTLSVVLAGSDVGTDVALDFVSQNTLALALKGQGISILKGALDKIGRKITTPEQLSKLQNLAANKAIPTDVTESAISNSEENIQWLKNNEKDVSDWIHVFKKENTKPKDPNNGVGNVSAGIFLATLLTLAPFLVKNVLL